MGVDSAKVEGVTANVPTVSEPQGNQASACMVGGAHAFILRISSFFGLAPLRFESRSNGFTVTLSGAMCIYSYILVTVLVICTIFGLVAEINVGLELSVRMSSKTSQVVSTCDVLVVVATAGAGVYGAPRRMRNMLKFMEHVASVDNSIGGQYSMVTERKLCAIILAILIFFSILLADDFTFYVLQAKKLDREWDVVTNYMGFYLLWFVVMVLELQFAFTALSVRARFAAVNDALALTARHVSVPIEKPKTASPLNIYAIRVAPVESQRSANVSLLVDSMTCREQIVIIKRTASGEPRLIVTPCDAVRRLASLHGTLCEVVQRIDDSYGLPLIVILISTLLHLIVTPYFLIMEIIVSTNRVHFLVLQFLWCLTHMLRMGVVVEPGHYTITEGKRTEGLVCRLMSSAPSTGVLPSRLEIFSRQLLLQSVSYAPLGMCTLSRPLMASIIGAVTTYLVILIQFQRYDTSGEPRLIVTPCDAVRRLASLHGTLCEVVQRIDDSYGLPLIVILISTLLHLIVTPYFLIMEIIVSTNRVHFLVLQFLWCLTHMLRMGVVVEPGHYTITEGKRTEGLVCRLMSSAPSTGVLPSRLEIFSRQLLLQSVSYAPLGMCTLSRPLMASIIGAVTTYLVILIQFQRYDS